MCAIAIFIFSLQTLEDIKTEDMKFLLVDFLIGQLKGRVSHKPASNKMTTSGALIQTAECARLRFILWEIPQKGKNRSGFDVYARG